MGKGRKRLLKAAQELTQGAPQIPWFMAAAHCLGESQNETEIDLITELKTDWKSICILLHSH